MANETSKETVRMPTRLLTLGALGLFAACGGGADRAGVPEGVLLATGQVAHDDPVLSPDGTRLAFTSRVRGDDAVWLADADGTNGKRVSQVAPDVNDPAWAPDGTGLVYAATDSTGGSDLYRVAAGGGAPVRLTRVAAEYIGGTAFSPDGSEILFESDHSGKLTLWLVPSGGGEPAELVPGTAGNALHGRWSPDGSQIAMNLGAEGGRFIAVLDRATGTVTRLTTEGTDRAPEWSPDGGEIVYLSQRTGAADLWVVPARGGDPRQLTVDVRPDYDPVYSPDGRWIAYVSERGGQPDVWLVPAAGGGATRVTNTRAHEFGLGWAADGSALLFVRGRVGQSLYAVPTSGGALRQIVPGTGGSFSPVVSPDGQMVAYEGMRGGVSGIYLVPIGGGEERPLVTESMSEAPSWSPDGSMIAFISFRDAKPSAWVISVASGEQWQASPVGVAARSVEWSPDGARVAFVVQEPGVATRSLFTVPYRGGEPTVVLENTNFINARPSPDGTSLAIHRPTGNNDRFGIFRAPMSGGRLVPLTAGQQVADSRADWSSDGRRLAYTVETSDGGSLDIFIMDSDGSGKRRLTTLPTPDQTPTWSADDSEIYFRSGFHGVSAVSVATGAIRQVFDGDLRVRGLGFSPDRSTLVVQAAPDGSDLVRVDLRGMPGRE